MPPRRRIYEREVSWPANSLCSELFSWLRISCAVQPEPSPTQAEVEPRRTVQRNARRNRA